MTQPDELQELIRFNGLRVTQDCKFGYTTESVKARETAIIEKLQICLAHIRSCYNDTPTDRLESLYNADKQISYLIKELTRKTKCQ